MSKLGSKERPAIVKVNSDERAHEILELCTIIFPFVTSLLIIAQRSERVILNNPLTLSKFLKILLYETSLQATHIHALIYVHGYQSASQSCGL